MFQLNMTFSTVEALQDAVLKLSGDANQLNLGLEKSAKTTKAAEKKAAASTATNEGLDAPKAPAAVGRPKGKATATKVYTLPELKEHISTFVDAATEGDKIKAYARSFGVAKYSDLTEDQVQAAYVGAEEYFAAAGGEPDPMD